MGEYSFIKHSIPCVTVNIPLGMEAVSVQIYFNNSPITICTAYIPPDYNNNSLENHMKKLPSFLPRPIIFCSDASGHHLNWFSAEADKSG